MLCYLFALLCFFFLRQELEKLQRKLFLCARGVFGWGLAQRRRGVSFRGVSSERSTTGRSILQSFSFFLEVSIRGTVFVKWRRPVAQIFVAWIKMEIISVNIKMFSTSVQFEYNLRQIMHQSSYD
ncbi:hypothetical protein XENOCAPTIV_008090 [Xenoophorus captivus]|uniref:Secreted protein n=1 Tax=Xenoophorus captivus TaxID=1517983 RepID=A0ABV0QRD0_9TELE